jgi:OPT family oligopeptide transporter
MSRDMNDDPEAVWLREVYRPDEPNLTVRAVIVGAVIGAIMCLSNIYVFFKAGWSMGVTITACILVFAVFQGLHRAGIVKRPLGVLENNAATTVASGAGYMTAGGNMSAYPALLFVISAQPALMLEQPDPAVMVLWFALIAALGVFAAIPIKRQLINVESLAFPTGTATAETIKSIHGADEPGGTGTGTSNKVRLLAYAGIFGAVVAWLRDAAKLIPGSWAPPINLAGHSLASWSIALKTEVILLGAGALMSFRTGWSLLLGGLVTYFVIAPELLAEGLITEVGNKPVVAWTLWPGAAMLVGAGLTTFALDYKSLGRAFAGIARVFRRRGADSQSGIAAVESPDWWFPAGFVLLGPFVVVLMAILFDIPVWAAIIAVPLAVIMGFIAARVTGETDVTPTKALGPVTQMVYGGLTPGNMSGNIMAANVTGGIGLHAADLLTTLKTGWLLGARPRHQLYAQLFGVVVGAAIVVPAFLLVIPDASVLGSEEWPAPSVLVWAGVSEAFANGLGGLHRSTQIAIGIGLAIGITLTLVDRFAPRRVKPYIPSPNGVGIAMILPCSNAIAMFLGSALGEVLRRRQQAGLVIPVASGLIAGESLMGVVIAVLVNAAGIVLEVDL